MDPIKAIGFDLFNTLIIADPNALKEAVDRLTRSLHASGLHIDYEPFRQAHREAATRFIKEAQQEGRETHNRFWISAALGRLGYSIPPEDLRIAKAVDAYFSAFFRYYHLIPGTQEMLRKLKEIYRIGLLSNFTHAPAARELIDRLGLAPFFDAVVISDEIGYRKPHPIIFNRFIEELGVEVNQILYVGDDPETDITGALNAGIHPVWMTYVRDHNLPFAPGYLSPPEPGPGTHVPRISTWNDLLTLLRKR